ncbi:mastermind-like protein 1 isoform X1 [Seriola lalandi dorsalis]|uniref:mastermind-like protein 1 isoform X1 n=2 Tax=Seriola lalandi dorsalis TaxID=1841481 RepID=UPI000C6F9C5A|nr:mastermind-like protein 1 isoform X1 [Seriola lalandi dorsalis]XP_023286364.1 mastermind-like protein 1 isoform X1 [Seriola lalandi dorsalis]
MMADFVTPRHSAVMERLRRRIELFRQHHNSCESRYENATLERLELERQQTFALHQRCLQAKAKRSNKHRQPQPSGDQAGQRAPGSGGGSAELGESGGTAAEQSRNSTLIALQETVKRKLESAGSPLGRDQVNGFSDGFPPNKKACLDNGTANSSPLDSKLGISDALNSNGTHGPAGESTDSSEPGSDFHRKEMKQEPDDILPIMPPSGGGNNSLFPDLNLNEQEWTELMEELNCSVAYEDIQDILNDGFEDRKDPLELAPTTGGGGAVGGGAGGGGGGQSSQGLLPPDLVSVKAEFSPASAVFEQDSRTGSPHVRSTSSGPQPHPTSSPIASSSASSPALPPSQPAPPPRQLQPPPNHLLPPGPPVPKDLSPAQQLQQLAAQQQRAVQHLHGQMQHKQPQPGAKFHNQAPHAHPPPWSQMANTSQSPLGGAFGMDKPTSPSLYPQDFNPNAQKQLLMPGQPNKGSPKAGAGGYMPGPGGHPNMLGHPTPGPPLSHPPAPGAQAQAAMLNYNNTKPLSHFEAGPGPPRPPNNQNQNKAALLTLLRHQQQIKQKNSMNFRQHIPHAQVRHAQDQNNYPAPPHGPGPANSMASAPGNNGMATQPGANAMTSNHGNTAYLSSQVAAVLKQQQQQQHQQQILEQQKQQQQYMQRQQLMAEQEKQRQQQDQQLQRRLTRPPPQYQDQPGQPANQNPFPQQPVNQFTASSQPMGSVGPMGGPSPGSQRMFPQNQGMMGMNMGQGGGPAGGVAPPPAASQADISLPSCGGGGGGGGVDVQQHLYNNMNLHPNHPGHPPQQPGLQRQPLGAMSAQYRQNLLAQQQHLKTQPNAAMLKQQQLAAAAARMPGSMQNSMGANLPGSMSGGLQGAQSAAWQQQLANQPPSSNTGLPPNAFNNTPNAFHMQQQPRIPKMPPGAAPFGANPGGRPMGGMNPGQQMMQTNMAAAQQRAPPNPQSLGQPMANQQQTQQQQANQNQAVLPDMTAFGQPQGNGRQGLQCNQGYQVSRTASQQQQVSFGYNVASGSFAAESDLVDSLLKGQNPQEWMADLDELLASHH